MTSINSNQAQYCQQLLDQGLRYFNRGEIDQAKTCYNEILTIIPNHSKTIFFLAHAYAAEKDFNQAVYYGERALALAPDQLNMQVDLAHWCNASSQYKKTLATLEPIKDKITELPNALSHLGHAYRRTGQVKQSIDYAKRSILLAYQHFSNHWQQFITQVSRYHIQLSVDQYYQLYQNKANLSQLLQQVTTWYQYIKTYRLDLGCSHLALKESREGWFHSENRGYPHQFYNDILLQLPYWRGEDLTGKTILILTEQGIGDETMFANSYADIIQSAERCIITCDPRLGRLYQESFSEAIVFGCRKFQRPWQKYLHQIDYVCLANSLFLYYRPTVDCFSKQAGWLKTVATEKQKWQQVIEALPPGFKVGIAWRSLKNRTGSDVAPEYLNIEELIPVLKTKGITFINLQYDKASAEIEQLQQQFGITVHQLPDLDTMDDFYALAQLMTLLDLIITPIISTYNLAGAVGAKTWVLRAPIPNYMNLGETTSPFFPNSFFYIKATYDDWSAVVEKVANDLQALTKQR